MQHMTMGCTALKGINKQGIFKPNADGYYELILGALEFPNSVGAVYDLQSGKALLDRSTGFSRRLRNGYCRGEYGHPKQSSTMSRQDWMRRIMTIEETRVCHHHNEIWIDRIKTPNTYAPTICFMGTIIPAGPYAEPLERSLLNPKENVAFSIRSITDDYIDGGRTRKHLREATGFDHVIEPGIECANKMASPALESMGVDLEIGYEEIAELAEDSNADNISMEAQDILKSALRAATHSKSRIILPGSANW